MKSMSELKYHYGLKMQAYPNARQRKIINLNINVARNVYNYMVAIDRDLYDYSLVKNLYIKQYAVRAEELKKQKSRQRYLANAHPKLYNKKIDSNAVANAKRNYHTAWENFKKVPDTKKPHFKKWGYSGSYQTSPSYGSKPMDPYSATVRFNDMNTVKLPKLGEITVCGSQERILKKKNDIKIGTTTVSRDSCGDYYISMQLGSDTPFVTELPPVNKAVGIDLNTLNFLETSDGIVVDNPQVFMKSIKRLKREMRKLSRRRTVAEKQHKPLHEAKNYQRQRKLVAKIYRHLTNQRQDFINKLVNTLMQNYDLIAAEDLKAKDMLGQSHNLNRSINDVGWGMFLAKAQVKAEQYNRKFIKVDPVNTTQMCSNCGHVMGEDGTKKLHFGKNNPRKVWVCPKCGAKHESDWNAAINILARAKDLLESDNDKDKKQKAA